ncbi:MAG: lactate racemase domain-containing protein [Chloroflexi bacterium]|nr:lactate racemase domain-containing protein [Chloroflexota bacterium]
MKHLLPPVLQGMRHAGVRDEDLLFIIATGTHPRMEPAEYETILPSEILETYRVVCHDADDQANPTFLGSTARDVRANQQRLPGRRLSHGDWQYLTASVLRLLGRGQERRDRLGRHRDH